MKTQLTILIVLVSALSMNCSKDYELSRPIFIPDSVFTDLPAYSEWGYNTFGAYFDRQAFVSNGGEVPAKVICTDTSVTFMLKGQKGLNYGYYYDGYGYSYGTGSAMSLSFILPLTPPDTLTDLVQWNNTVVDLTTPGCRIFLTEDTLKTEVQVLSGSLQFKRAQVLWVDDRLVEVILSGRFSLRMMLREEPYSLTEGRFDVGVGEDSFYRL
jgi:hypothetical protein